MKKAIFFYLLAMLTIISLTHAHNTTTSCPAPANVSKVFSASSSISYDWDDCTGGCLRYEVRYVRLADGYTSSWYSTSVSNFTFSGLASGDYQFLFKTVCIGGASEALIIEDIIWI